MLEHLRETGAWSSPPRAVVTASSRMSRNSRAGCQPCSTNRRHVRVVQCSFIPMTAEKNGSTLPGEAVRQHSYPPCAQVRVCRHPQRSRSRTLAMPRVARPHAGLLRTLLSLALLHRTSAIRGPPRRRQRMPSLADKLASSDLECRLCLEGQGEGPTFHLGLGTVLVHDDRTRGPSPAA